MCKRNGASEGCANDKVLCKGKILYKGGGQERIGMRREICQSSEPEVGSVQSPGKRKSEPAALQLQRGEPVSWTWSQTVELAVALWAAAVSRLSSHRSRPRAPGSTAPVGASLPPLLGAGFSTTNSATVPREPCALAAVSASFHLNPEKAERTSAGLNPARALISSSSSRSQHVPDRRGPQIFLSHPMVSILCERSGITKGEEAMVKTGQKMLNDLLLPKRKSITSGVEGIELFFMMFCLLQALIAALNTVFQI